MFFSSHSQFKPRIRTGYRATSRVRHSCDHASDHIHIADYHAKFRTEHVCSFKYIDIKSAKMTNLSNFVHQKNLIMYVGHRYHRGLTQLWHSLSYNSTISMCTKKFRSILVFWVSVWYSQSFATRLIHHLMFWSLIAGSGRNEES